MPEHMHLTAVILGMKFDAAKIGEARSLTGQLNVPLYRVSNSMDYDRKLIPLD